jgi:hypothetical protein
MFICSPSTYSHSAVDTKLNLLKLALRLEWPARIRFIDTKAPTVHLRVYLAEPQRRGILVVPLKVAFSSLPFGVVTESVSPPVPFFFHWALNSVTGDTGDSS